MPSKRENLEQLLDKNLSKTSDQARRESQSISSILQRFGGPDREVEASSSPPEEEKTSISAKLPVPNNGIPVNGTPNLGIPLTATPQKLKPIVNFKKERAGNKQSQKISLLVDPTRGWLALPNDMVDKVFPTL